MSIGWQIPQSQMCQVLLKMWANRNSHGSGKGDWYSHSEEQGNSSQKSSTHIPNALATSFPRMYSKDTHVGLPKVEDVKAFTAVVFERWDVGSNLYIFPSWTTTSLISWNFNSTSYYLNTTLSENCHDILFCHLEDLFAGFFT